MKTVISGRRQSTRSVLECATAHDAAEVDSPAAAQSARGLARFKTWRSFGAALALTLGLLPPSLPAETSSGGRFSLNGGPLTGGGKSGGGTFAVTGGAGETATGPLSGGRFEVTGGLIGVAVIPGDVALDFTTAEGQVTLTWPSAPGYLLEFTPQIGTTSNWQPVTPAPPGNTFTTPFNQPLRFFRLRKP